MEQGKSFDSLLVITSKQIDLFVVAQEGGIVSDGWEEGIEASVDKWVHAKVHVHVGSLISLDWRGLYNGDSFFLYFLEFGYFFLFEFVSGKTHLILEIAAEGGIEFAVIFVHGGLQIGSVSVHFEHDFGK